MSASVDQLAEALCEAIQLEQKALADYSKSGSKEAGCALTIAIANRKRVEAKLK
jgi:hypothetical protein